jgi:ADP-heptose:LPS heptosyltransferase
VRILFITATRIGDAVLSTGLLAHLIERHPDAAFTVACGPAAAPLFEDVPQVERRIPMAKRPWGGHWLGLWSACVTRRWDLVVDLRGSAMAWLLATRHRLVHGGKNGNHDHRLTTLARVMELAEPPSPRLWVSDEHAAQASRLVPDDGPVLALAPTANWAGKIWPAENFIAMAERLTAPGGILPNARIAVFGAADERAIAQLVIDALPEDRCIDLVGETHLLTAAAALGRCALFVGNDSGLMHMAAAMATPTLGLFGPSHHEAYGPWGPHCAVARTATPYAELFPPDYNHRTTGSLMGSLPVDTVEDAAVALWNRCQGAAA